MKPLFLICLFLSASMLNAQSYVDSGIRHFAAGEYDEALIAFKDAAAIESIITESSQAKLYYYRGMIWLMRAEKSSANNSEGDPIELSYQDLTRVLAKDDFWKPQIEEAYGRLYTLIIDKAESYLKLQKKADDRVEKLKLLDDRISYLILAEGLETSSMPTLYIAQTNMQAGDLIFDNSTDFQEMQQAKKYYEESLKYYEQARYEDPFSKKIIQDLLKISTRLGDTDRIAEYEKLLELAGG